MNQLRQALATLVELASQVIDELDDETMLALSELLNAAAARLQQMSQGPQEAPITPPSPELEPGPYPSSNVNSFKYDPTTQQLYVKFHGKDSADSGPTYLYQNIPRNIYDVFSKGRVAPRTSGRNRYHQWIRGVTPSLGASLYALIREGGFPYQRLS